MGSVSGGDDKAAARTVAVIVLVVLAAVALRGYLPGATPADRGADSGPESGDAASLIPVAVMIVLSLAIIAMAILRQARHPARRSGSAGELLSAAGARDARWTPRTLAILAAVAVVWLVTVMFLMRLRGWIDLPEPPPPQGSDEPQLPLTGRDPADPAEPPPGATGGVSIFGYLAAATAALIVLSAVATTLGRRRQPAPEPEPEPAEASAPVTGSQSLARAAERGLAEIGDLSREPREAIIACYAAMERELEKSPGAMPLDSDTPSEVLARAVQRRLLRADSATELVDLFEEARFSPHVMAEEHRDAAERVLRHVLGELQATEGAP
ncbi:DUF4129 domain-containing protein [Mycolicibacterium sp. S2-37]|uniref:DUF4129 domain-containing protein n=1 Tax=Mycolicibacterium sp. S2-37 TaxID=2810297 RepID=UPI001A93AEFA|nr:DUF4129 domain-containing protein [Mycolicibacterium sp. S2-37]MBO0678529.1 DUF4129 domain-containing protein [Mycolicibacterium sp. S2-37]